MTAELSGPALAWFIQRGISRETLTSLGIYSGARQQIGDDSVVVPISNGNIIVFPYREGGRAVAEKYRSRGKKFAQKPNCRKTFFNCEIIDDPALIAGDAALVITEGEIDCLSAIECGHRWAVSVPDGAPPARDGEGNLIVVPEGTEGIDPAEDEKYRYISNNWDRLKLVKRIIIATDSDEPGRRLAAELVRRLGRVRCSFVTYPEGCKDLNEVLMTYGASEVIWTINYAKPYPVSGVYGYDDLPDEPDIQAVTSGWHVLDNYLKLYHPALMVVTGFAGQGKSTWTTQLVAKLASLHRWPVAIASFEMRLKPYVTDLLAATHVGVAKATWNDADKINAISFLRDRFSFIAPEPDCIKVHDIDWLLEKAEVSVIRFGARVLLIDPWNEIEHARDARETMTEYTNKAIHKIKDFARRFDMLIIIVAHPTKGATSKNSEDVTLYDISDSAAFQNKADLGVVIARLGDPSVDTRSGVFVKKVRYQPSTGTIGSVELAFDRQSGMFIA